MELNYKHIMLLLGCGQEEAKRLIYAAIYKESKPLGLSVPISRTATPDKFYFLRPNLVEEAISLIKTHGISYSALHDILNDEGCIRRQRLMGEYKEWKDLLPQPELDRVLTLLRKRHMEKYKEDGELQFQE